MVPVPSHNVVSPLSTSVLEEFSTYALRAKRFNLPLNKSALTDGAIQVSILNSNFNNGAGKEQNSEQHQRIRIRIQTQKMDPMHVEDVVKLAHPITNSVVLSGSRGDDKYRELHNLLEGQIWDDERLMGPECHLCGEDIWLKLATSLIFDRLEERFINFCGENPSLLEGGLMLGDVSDYEHK
ncbi:hypothetical protein Fcan01_25486 [Folsomia candida]|uniref:Uncharacterized protein n=1 Tax=Folsomia candida TaxID=158441 RepID=A0A226D4U3_FOLCA|nr:hypothetical protein Fcan01_25486 [Folsomia candida]